MRLGDRLPLFAGKRINSSELSDENVESRIKSEATSVNNEERVYSLLGESFSKPGVIKILRLALSLLMLVLSATLKISSTIQIYIQIAAALIVGYDIVLLAFGDLSKRIFLRESPFVTIAAIISFSIGRGAEAVIALVLLQIAFVARDYALYRTKISISNSLKLQNINLSNSTAGIYSDSAEYTPGYTFRILSGMTVPTDCIVSEGFLTADLSYLTGDSSPVLLSKGDFLPANSVCLDGKAFAECLDQPENTLNAKIGDILNSGYGKITETERKWTDRAGLIVPFSLIVSVTLMFILPLVFHLSVAEAFRRVITIIAIASPCGILLSVPLSYFAGMAEAKSSGIIFRDASALERSALIRTAVFNKVGTLTGKNYTVTEIKTDKMDTATFLKVAAYAESKSKGAVARAIVAAYGGEISEELIRDFVEYQGKGVSVNVDGIRIILGNGDFINENGVLIPEGAYEGSAVHMSVNGIYAGRISLNEIVSPETSENLKKLYSVGIERIAMVSGDGRMRDRAVSTALGISEYYAECSPKEKVLRIESMKDRTDSRGFVAFIGSCDLSKQLFDAADVGISINSIACRSELPKSDVMIMTNSIRPIATVVRAGKKTNRFIMLGMLIDIFIKLAIMTLAALGIAPLWFGLLIDICASFIVLLCCSGKIPVFQKIMPIANSD